MGSMIGGFQTRLLEGNSPMIVIAKTRPRRGKSTAAPAESLLDLPTPEMIEERAAEIRKRWSPRVTKRRRAEAWHNATVAAMPLEPRRKGFWGD